jgi:hypothetical protein
MGLAREVDGSTVYFVMMWVACTGDYCCEESLLYTYIYSKLCLGHVDVDAKPEARAENRAQKGRLDCGACFGCKIVFTARLPFGESSDAVDKFDARFAV